MATRQQKYPETSIFRYHNANPKNRLTTDCVIRAICTALDQTWDQTLRELTEVGIENCLTATNKDTYTKYLAQKGFSKCKQPRKEDNTKYTGYEWINWLYENAKQHPSFKSCKAIVAHIGGHHLVCLKLVDEDDQHRHFKIHDTWDSSDGCIGNYWIIK